MHGSVKILKPSTVGLYAQFCVELHIAHVRADTATPSAHGSHTQVYMYKRAYAGTQTDVHMDMNILKTKRYRLGHSAARSGQEEVCW